MDTVSGIQEFVSYVVHSLADYPEKATVTPRQEGERQVINVRVDQRDIARLLGHSGNTIMAVRNLAIAAAGLRGVQVGVEILE